MTEHTSFCKVVASICMSGECWWAPVCRMRSRSMVTCLLVGVGIFLLDFGVVLRQCREDPCIVGRRGYR